MTEIAKPEQNPANRFQAHADSLAVEASFGANSVDEWIMGKLTMILEAEDFEAINALMTQTGLTPSKSLVGRTLEIQDFALRESAEQYRANSALKKVTYVKAVDTSTSEDFVIDGGGDQFVAGLLAMRDRYGFPFTGTLLSMSTGSGNELLYWRFQKPKQKRIP